MRRRLLTVFVLGATLCLLASSALAQTPSADGDDRVTGHPYVRHDGGTDQAIQECSSPATNPAPDNVADDGDIDSNDGGNRHQNNEPFSVIDPTNPNMVVAGWNDYCSTDLGAGWMGLGFSADRGETWVNSLVPSYHKTPRPRAWPRRCLVPTPTPATRWPPLTGPATCMPAGSPSTGSGQPTAMSGWPST